MSIIGNCKRQQYYNYSNNLHNHDFFGDMVTHIQDFVKNKETQAGTEVVLSPSSVKVQLKLS